MKNIIIVISLLCICSNSWGQGFLGQKEYLNRLQKESTKLYEYEKRLYEIQDQIQAIMLTYKQKKVEQEEFELQITPLLREEIQIKNNPEYLIQQRLYGLMEKQKIQDFQKASPVSKTSQDNAATRPQVH